MTVQLTAKEIIAAAALAVTIISAVLYAGRLLERIDILTVEVNLLRRDMGAINTHFITWTQLHEETR